jgi:hypothetical protein
MNPGAREARQLMPPWLWVWLIGDVAILIPSEISNVRFQVAEYTGHGDVSSQLTAGVPYKLLLLFAVLAALTYAILAMGAIAAVFPHIRGRWVERRHRLAESDDAVIAEMQRFVSLYDPAIQLRVGVSNRQAARIYPVGWRVARIAVFLPLSRLWNRDRPAAEAILLHEVAHRRHGDQFVVGLGSPFTWLLRTWVPAFIVLGLVPIMVYAALGGGKLAQAVGGQGALQLVQPAVLLVLPVMALWLAELNADSLTSQIAGSPALQDALLAMTSSREAPVVARSLALLSHPPRRLRLRLARARRASTAVVLAAWPAALVAQLAVVIAGALIAYLLIGTSSHDTGVNLLAGTRLFLVSNRILVTAALVLVLLWPVLALPWDRLWSSGPRGVSAAPGPGAGRLPWPPYLAAAAIPAALLGASFAPLPANFVSESRPPSACAQLAAWNDGGGLRAKEGAEAATRRLLARPGPATNSRALIAAATAAVDDPPPGPARDSYLTAMNDLIAGARDYLAGRPAVGLSELASGVIASGKATSLLEDQIGNCVQLTTAELRADLLTTASLPPALRRAPLPADLPAASSKPACLSALSGLTVGTPPSATTRQAGVAFTAGEAGQQFEEVLRSYPPQEAAPAFTAITRELTGCSRFTVGWTNPAATGTETVTPSGPVALGSQSWSAAIVVTAAGIPFYETLILIRKHSALAAVQVASAGGSPATLARQFAALAVTKLP